MKSVRQLSVIIMFIMQAHSVSGTVGITPEQIYQSTVDWQTVVGTWEALPEQNPLAEQESIPPKTLIRTIMTLRKDGTCRLFNAAHTVGADGIWTFDNHEMFIKLPNGEALEFYVYGIKGDFMITRSPVVNGKDQLWSKVK